MDYIELNVPVTGSEQAEIVTAMLADLPFDSFAEERGVLKAYIPKEALIDCKEEADRLLTDMGLHGWTYIEIETQNWNALWESHFEPVEVDGASLISCDSCCQNCSSHSRADWRFMASWMLSALRPCGGMFMAARSPKARML